MRAFSQLLDDLVYTRSRTTKLRLIGDYFKSTPDPDRGIALAALTGTLDIPAVKPAVVRALAEERIDPVLLKMSRDYVGDMAETVSLLCAHTFRLNMIIYSVDRVGTKQRAHPSRLRTRQAIVGPIE